ncbi:hypothetical protein SETIT_4G213500v2 [Setaria italica]|uniref:Reverse transcriptase zinc-binding domain-containing protein n=1 Tax=Setaria italica TaxID=4555 RepID=A0A368QWN2_SETIT|nr:hypothetical protein SETIT_4G213500v2 [Setaria italica]
MSSLIRPAKCADRGSEETSDHLIFGCPFSKWLWQNVGIDTDGCSVAKLWKHRSGVVFQSLPLSISHLLMACKEDARLWRARWKCADRRVVDVWCMKLACN